MTPEQGPIAADRMLDAIGTGILIHDTKTKATYHITLNGNAATVTGRGQNTGRFRGLPIAAYEWIADIYHRINGQWQCVLTHLTPALVAQA